MKSQEMSPGNLLGISGAYWQTCALHSAVKLDIFTTIGKDKKKLEKISEQTGFSQRSLAMLLNAMCAMDLLKKQGTAYMNTAFSKTFLCKDSAKYMGFMIMHHHHLVESWFRLDESIKSGIPVRTQAEFADEEKRESFLMGMFNIAMGMAPELVATIDLKGRKKLLDFGGGPGTYAIHFCMHNKGLEAVIFDRPTTRPFAEKTVASFGQQNRISFQPGDFLEDPIKGRYDVVWLSHILHGDSPRDCEKIVEKAVSVLEPGGMILIHDFILDNEKDGPLFPALFSLNMLLATEGGQAYSENEIKGMLKRVGIINIERTSYRGAQRFRHCHWNGARQVIIFL